ncbi:hypothetical protein QG082_06495 [Kingella kingae]|uniref:hypothetical protein n=1 Tax=Kingella kingae TaxID=504 RepID=UPI00254E87E4|nr:hypothetical protein [Kingella kingae]MDK4528583.1 hypothetical protein [Kingella kingae]MDK4543136.1 hypothetical protein [Kingella kingae]MDK4562662.1 hypothetical protein [Kingella kingae]MDK4602891.1 hypothetical protein [Kingella kingae]MDK4632746.1 hypothetical protein [Kingella kingae]
MTTSQQAQTPISSDIPQCFYNGKKDIYELNETAYLQIERVADMLAALACFSHGNDKREEQLFNTLHFAATLLEQSLNWNCK